MSSPIPKKSSLNQQLQDEDDMEVPANVDEVAMIHNIKEETDHYNASPQENNETLVRYITITVKLLTHL